MNNRKPPPSSTPETALVTADFFANLRQGPGIHYDRVGSLNKDETAIVTGRSPDGLWWQISFEGDTVWVADSQVTVNASAQAVQIASDLPPTPEPPTPIPTTVPEGPGRRVVTGVDADGKSTIILDDQVRSQIIWRIPVGAADLTQEIGKPYWSGMPGELWTEARVVRWGPGSGYPTMHRTQSLDFACLCSGQIELILENGSTVVGPGECVIQRGTQHAWRVVGDEPFVGCGIMVGASEYPHPVQEPPKITPGAVGPERRVVTGVDAEGKSIVIMDGPLPDNATYHDNGGIVRAIWKVPSGPVDLTDETDPSQSWSPETELNPGPGGVQGRIFTWEPGYEDPMHQTDTLDFVFIVSGQMELILETDSTVLSPGETVVQRGTAHGWRVVGDEPSTFFVFKVGAER